MKALVQGYFGYGNVGDEAICSVLIDELRVKYGTEVVVPSLNPERTVTLHQVKSCPEKLTSREFVKQLLTSHALVFGGGGRYGKRTIRRMCLFALLAKMLGKRLEFRALGIYPYEWNANPFIRSAPSSFDDPLTRILLMLSVRLADKISVRDVFSKSVLSRSGVQRPIEIEEDLAFKLKPSKPERGVQILAENGVDVKNKVLIGINLRTMQPKINGKVKDITAKVIDWLVEKYNAEVVFVPFGFGSTPDRFFDDDLRIASKLKNAIRNKHKFKLISREHRPQEVLSIFTFFDAFIGMRFHSIIFSAMSKIPTIALVYDLKVEELSRGMQLWCIYLDELDENLLRGMVEGAIACKAR